MKNLFLTILLFAGLTAAHAQSNQQKSMVTAEQKAEESINKLKTELTLTEEQVPKVKAITIDKINKVTAAHKKNGADKNRLQAANKLIQEEYETALKGILTEEQFKKYHAK
jgi:periplasmic protein CpxP/Spy